MIFSAKTRSVDVLDTVNQAAGAAQRNGVTAVGAFITSLSLSLAVLAVGTLTCIVGRNRHPRVYQPRSFTLDPSRQFRLPSGLLASIRVIVKNDVDLSHHSGLDAYLFLRFLGGSAVYFGLATIVACPILIPLNVAASKREHAQGLNRLKWTSSSDAPVYVACHTLVTVFLSVLLCWLIWLEWQNTLQLREKDMWTGTPRNSHAVVIRYPQARSPEEWDTAVKLYDHRLTGPKRYSPRHYSRITAARRHVFEKREELESLAVKIMAQGVREKTGVGPLARQCDHLGRWQRLVRRCWGLATRNPDVCAQEYRAAVEELHLVERQQPGGLDTTMVLLFPDPCSASLAAFTREAPSISTVKSLTTAMQSKAAGSRVSLIRFADINWENLAAASVGKCWRVGTKLFLGVMIIAWAVPIAFSGSLPQLGSLSSYSPFFRWLDGLPPRVMSILQGCLPPLLTTGLIVLFQTILRSILATRRPVSKSAQELSVQRYHFGFLWVHPVLITSLASGLSMAAVQILANPNNTMVLLAENLPQASNFFLVYVLLRVFMEAGCVLAQPVSLGKSIFRWGQMTPRQLEHCSIQQVDDWGTSISVHTMLSSIVIVYAPLAPLMLPIGALAFGVLWVIYRYFFLSIACGHGNSEGRLNLQMLSHLFVALWTMLVCSTGLPILSSMGHFSPSRIVNIVLRGVTLISTIFFSQYLHDLARRRLNTAISWTHTDTQGGGPDSVMASNAADRSEAAFDTTVVLPTDSCGLGPQFQRRLDKMGVKVEVTSAVQLNDKGHLVPMRLPP